MKLATRTPLWLLLAGQGPYRKVHHSSTGVDGLRQVLQHIRQDVEAEALNSRNVARGGTPSTAQGKGVAATNGTDAFFAEESANGLLKTAKFVKELLRIFTRKVPGGLVPDGLVRGFMQAYTDLTNPPDRLAFFLLLSHEMGLSTTEVSSAVQLWAAVQARPSPSSAAAAGGAAAAAPADATPVHRPPPLPTSPAAGGTGDISSGGAAAAAATEFPSDVVYRAADRLGNACRPLYTQLFLPISQAPEGMKFLATMRADLLQLLTDHPQQQQQQQQHHKSQEQQQRQLVAAPEAKVLLRVMADHLRQSLADWFCVGLLHLQPISWHESPAALLERVMRCEAVHPVDSWEELRRRLGPGRRVFAFTHPCMPGEPLVVLHTALMDGPAAAMSDILGKEQQQPQQHHHYNYNHNHRQGQHDGLGKDFLPHPHLCPHTHVQTQHTYQTSVTPHQPTTAVFYSISASQPGLRGIDLGQFLIKRVAERLMAEHPTIRRLVTLSPLPNYRAWLISRLRQEQSSVNAAAAAAAAAPPPQLKPGLGAATADGNGGGSGGGGDVPLLHSHEVESVIRLARAMGWAGTPSANRSDGDSDVGQATAYFALAAAAPPEVAAAAAPAAAAAAALCWMLEGDRWLPDRGGLATLESDARDVTGTAGGGGGGLMDGQSGSTAGGGDAAAAVEVLRPLLIRLVARYLVTEKRRRFALCPVAHFHLRNGASLWRLNWGADMSPLGLSRSFGIMVNYEYELPCVYDNNWRYIMLHEIQAHPQVLELL